MHNQTATKIEHSYVIKNPKIHGGEPILKGTRFPVRSIVFYVLKEGMLPEQLAREFKHLHLSAIHDALSYYYEHRSEIDHLIKQNTESEWKRKV